MIDVRPWTRACQRRVRPNDLGRVVSAQPRHVAEIEIRFTEQEVAQILWMLSEASDLAGATDALSSLALIEQTLRMVRERFDRRSLE